jgi:hypothetical protein
MIIAIDFDGTCVTHEYPKIGRDIGAVPVLKKLVEEGHPLILWTVRSGDGLYEAVKWFRDNDIPLYGVNLNPTQKEWSQSLKAYAHMYIDDAALGIPLVRPDIESGERPYVNWSKVEAMLRAMGLIKG